VPSSAARQACSKVTDMSVGIEMAARDAIKLLGTRSASTSFPSENTIEEVQVPLLGPHAAPGGRASAGSRASEHAYNPRFRNCPLATSSVTLLRRQVVKEATPNVVHSPQELFCRK
jgi:hypothetical protein